MNRVTLIGHLGADPESRSTNSGSTVTNLRLATKERQKDRDGNWGDHTEWHRVVCFGRTAETASAYLSKGRQVAIEGRLRTNKWEDKDGNSRYTTEVIADRLHFIGSKDAHGRKVDHQNTAQAAGTYGGGAPSDDIPF